MSEIKLVIFDYDGVLFDTFDLVYSLVKAECDKYCKIPIKTKKEFHDLYKGNFYKTIKLHGLEDNHIEKMIQESIKKLKQVQEPPFEGVPEMLEKISGGSRLAVVSSNFKKVMEANLERENILKYFDNIEGADKIVSKVEKIKALIEKFKLDGSEVLFITDTAGDIKEGKAAGVKTMAVTWGYFTKQELQAEKPDYIVDKPMEIVEALE